MRSSPQQTTSGILGPQTMIVLGAALLGVAVIAMWLPGMTGSLWLDETGTAFMTRDGLGETMDRAARFQGQSPFYYVVAWLFRRAGSSEAMMRLPSLLAMAGALAIVVRVAAKRLDTRAGLFAGVLFAASGSVAFAAADARPYAIATLLLVASIAALASWLNEKSRARASVYVVLAAATIYAHFLFALGIAGQLIYLTSRPRTRGAGFGLSAGIAIVTAPLLTQLAALAARRDDLTFPASLSAARIVDLVLLVVLAVALWVTVGRRTHDTDDSFTVMLWSMAALPTLAMPAAAAIGLLPFEPRYLLTMFPPLALVAGDLLSRARSTTVAAAALIAFTVTSAALFPSVRGVKEQNWARAASLLREAAPHAATPVLVRSGFIEAVDPSWLTTDPERRYLLAPFLAYPIEAAAIPLPYDLRSETRVHATRIVEEAAEQDVFFLVSGFQDPFSEWIAQMVTPRGFEVTRLSDQGGVLVVRYQKG